MFDYHPHIAQMDFHLSPARFRMAIAGTRGGKSRAAGEEVIPYLFAGATRVWIVGQNYSLTEKEFRYVYERMTSPQVAALFGGQIPLEAHAYNESQGNMYLRTKWGAEVKCISLERSQGAFGEEVDLIVLSEAAQIKRPRELYERILFGRLSSRSGDVIIPTTPAGRTNKHDADGWLFDMYQAGYDPDRSEYYTREWPSWENPTFTEDPYWLRSWMNPLVFSEQYEGKFMVFSGAVFDKFDANVHVVAPFKPPAHWNRYEAIDPGFAGKFVWISSVTSEAGNLFINDEYSDSETDYETRAKAILEHRAAQYNIHPDLWDVFVNKNNLRSQTYVDSEDPQCIAELTKYGVPGIGANKKEILVSVDRVARRLKYARNYPPQLYITSNCTDTIDAMKMHSWGEKGSGVRKPANDAYKHWCDCVRYICGGYLRASEPLATAVSPDGETYWDMLMQMTGVRRKHPHDLTSKERRRAA